MVHFWRRFRYSRFNLLSRSITYRSASPRSAFSRVTLQPGNEPHRPVLPAQHFFPAGKRLTRWNRTPVGITTRREQVPELVIRGFSCSFQTCSGGLKRMWVWRPHTSRRQSARSRSSVLPHAQPQCLHFQFLSVLSAAICGHDSFLASFLRPPKLASSVQNPAAPVVPVPFEWPGVTPHRPLWEHKRTGAVRWQSGRMRRSRKPLNLHGFPGFESLPHRQNSSSCTS